MRAFAKETGLAEWINEGVHIGAQGGDIDASAALEREPSVVPGLLDRTEDVGVVDFTCSGFPSAGVVGDVEMADFFDVVGDVADEVALRNLLMINVEE